MKKLALFFVSALFFAACANEQLQPEIAVTSVEATAESLVEGTKANVSDAGAFTWQTGDVISAYKTDGTKLNSSPLGVGGSVTANFEFASTWNSTDYPTAYYPSDVTYADSKVTVPATRAWVADNTAPTMRAEFSGAYNFKHLGGVVRVQINNVPAEARKFVFKTPGYKINGEFALVEAAGVYSIATATSADEAEQTFTLTFDAPVAGAMNFYVPVPVGTYANGFSISLLNGSDEAIYAKTGASSQSVALKQLILMSPITLAGGVGEGATTILNAGANYSGNFELPNTTNDVLIKFGPSTGTVNLVYGGSNHPAKVEIQVEGTLAKLTGNLPSSHVEFTTGTIEDATLLTSATTFVVVHPAKISKSLTIAGGNAEIKGHVRNIVIADGATADGAAAPVTVTIPAPQSGDVYEPVSSITANESVVIDNNTGNNIPVVEGNDDVEVNVPDGDTAITPVEGVVAIGDAQFETIEAAIAAAQAGETITILEDLTSSAIIVVDKAITIDGNGKTLTSTLSGENGRAININVDGEVTVKNLTIIASGQRGFNVIQKPATLNINNVTATAANYTVNVASSAGAATVNIDNSILTGLNVVNIAGPGTKVSVQNSTINCNDDNTTKGESYAGLCLNKDAIGASIIATNTTINIPEGSDSEKGRNGADEGVVTIDGSTEDVSISVAAIIVGNYYYGFTDLAEAVEFAEPGNKISLIRNITLDAPITINADKSLTLDLNGKTISYSSAVAGDAMITNKGKITIQDSKGEGKISYTYTGTPDSSYGKGNYTIQNSGSLTLSNGTIENLTAKMSHASYAINTNAGATVNINGGKVINKNSHAIRMVSFGTSANNMVITDGYVEGTRAIMMQLPGSNPEQAPEMSLTINGGEIKSLGESGGYTIAIYLYSSGQSAENVKINITDGIITGDVMVYAGNSLATGAVNITGGTFSGSYGVYNYGSEADDIAVKGGTFASYYAYPLNYLADNANVTLGSDMVVGSPIVIGQNKVVTLDLNGKTISQEKAQTAAYAMITNKGTLTIKDSKGNGKITYKDITEYSADNNYASNTISNQGTLTLVSGTIENTSSDNVKNYGYPHAIDVYQGSVTNIQGGTVKSVNYDCIRMFCNSTTAATTVNISGGNIINRVTFQNPSSNAAGYGRLNITGGTFTTTDSVNANVRLLNFSSDVSNMKAVISGGTFDKGVKTQNYGSWTADWSWLEAFDGITKL